ncbi:hypothetical protein [Nonlabens ponticola]|uniref:Uncharacterized protein n=1 Tax=Nonlabens ponticola TaxID=2496866 RepID=A0A3S9MWG6_9FLAO|nr:hypothetical protein [Nonlabens ponticola]AZQ43477.1 hypothetical protein EJ995_04230 [Nonlabens ponticola]
MSCNNQEDDVSTETTDLNLSEIEFAQQQISLVGDARASASDWQEFERFQTALENYDHSKAATTRLATHAESMLENVPDAFDEQRIKSRIKVLLVRSRSYESYLSYTTRTASEHQDRYNGIILATDQLIAAMNEKEEYDRNQRQALEDLKNDLPPAASDEALDTTTA